MKNLPLIALVLPCFNEASALDHSIPAIANYISELKAGGICDPNSYAVFIDDGSADNTWDLIVAYSSTFNSIRGIRLINNVGQQNALICGLEYATNKCDLCITLDADLQHDIKAIPEMIRNYQEGAQIVMAVRKTRETDGIFKKLFSSSFYFFMRIVGVNLVVNHADFRLLASSILIRMGEFGEANLFLRGIIPMLGLNQRVIYFDCQERVAGKTKYSFKKMLSLALDGVTSFTIAPLRLVSLVGLLIFSVSFGMGIYVFIIFFSSKSVPGWASIVLPLYFLGGIIMLSIGILGEYLGKIFQEVKRRPRFLIESIVGQK